MKILIIRFSSIGDIVLTTPVLRALHKQVPGARIHYLTKVAFAPLIEHSPYVEKVHKLENDLGAVVPALKSEQFDLVVDLHNNLRTAAVKRMLGRPSRSFAKLNWEKWLLVNFKKDRMPARHIVDRYMDTLIDLGVRNDGEGLELSIPASAQLPADTLPATHRSGYTALCIGGAHRTKRLPAFKLIELGQQLAGPIVVVGGKEDQETAALIADAVGARVFDATGRFDLLGSAQLIAGARSVIAHDSAAMHMASAFKRPVVSVWGNTVPAFGMGPYLPTHPQYAHIVEVPGLKCRPCSKIGHDRCPQGHFDCMEKQDVAKIAALAAR